MANNAVKSRLKGFVSSTNDENAGGYDLLGRVRDAGLFFATGQVPQQRTPASDIDTRLKMQRLETGSPKFQKELAQTKADVAMQQQLDLEDAKVKQAQERYRQSHGQTPSSGSTYGVQSSPDTAPLNSSNSPLGTMGKGSVSPFLSRTKWDSNLGMDIEEQIDNPEYLNPMDRMKVEQNDLKAKEAEAQKLVAEDNMRSNSQSRLSAIQEAKRGAKFFGPMGEVPSYLAPSSLVGQYGERAKWENNVNQLLSQKVLNVMNEMKRASKTGATGFGALSEKELQILQSAATALKKNLDPKDAMMYLNDMERIEQKFLGQDVGGGTADNQPNIPSFASDQEALAYAKKNNYRGKVLINGEEVELGD